VSPYFKYRLNQGRRQAELHANLHDKISCANRNETEAVRDPRRQCRIAALCAALLSSYFGLLTFPPPNYLPERGKVGGSMD
jgi:hypothetical protein